MEQARPVWLSCCRLTCTEGFLHQIAVTPHIGCAMLVWLRLKDIAYKTGQTIYQLKHGLLSDYLIQQLKRPAIPMLLV